MYLKTGGNPRLLSDYIINDKCDSYSVSMRHFQSNQSDPNDMIKYKILEAVYKCTNAYVDKDFISTTEELPTNISAFQTWTKLIKYRIISEKIETDEKFEVLTLIYNLADSGHIRFIDDRFETYGLIGLGSPLIYLQLASKGNNEITLDEAVALKSPNTQPNDDIAENITLRFLAQNASKLFQVDSNFRIIDTDVQKIVLKYEYTNILVKEVHANYDQDQIVNRLFKECYENNKDVFGMDGLLLEEDQLNGNELIAHRIQIKLGSSCIRDEDANKIIDKVNSQQKNFEKCFQAGNKKMSRCVNYLVTTRGIQISANKLFNENGWKIVGKKELEQIWPDSIKALGKPYK